MERVYYVKETNMLNMSIKQVERFIPNPNLTDYNLPNVKISTSKFKSKVNQLKKEGLANITDPDIGEAGSMIIDSNDSLGGSDDFKCFRFAGLIQEELRFAINSNEVEKLGYKDLGEYFQKECRGMIVKLSHLLYDEQGCVNLDHYKHFERGFPNDEGTRCFTWFEKHSNGETIQVKVDGYIVPIE